MLHRFTDWPKRLAVFLASRRYAPFEWGANDCCTFSCDGIIAITGTDVAKEFRGYSTEAGAVELIAQHGSIEALVRSVTSAHEMPTVPILKARRGDMVLFTGPLGPTIGIVSLDGNIASPGVKEMMASPITQGTVAWRVG